MIKRFNPQQLKSLVQRLHIQQAEAQTCTTAAQARCVNEAIDDTIRQLADMGVDVDVDRIPARAYPV